MQLKFRQEAQPYITEDMNEYYPQTWYSCIPSI